MSLPASPLPSGQAAADRGDRAGRRRSRLLADFGRIVAGQVQFEVSAPAGTIFDLCYVEDPLTGKEQGMFGAPHTGTRYIARGAR